MIITYRQDQEVMQIRSFKDFLVSQGTSIDSWHKCHLYNHGATNFLFPLQRYDSFQDWHASGMHATPNTSCDTV